jgi:ABC-type transport system involved in multi-copper enzyme maturation permease subunit
MDLSSSNLLLFGALRPWIPPLLIVLVGTVVALGMLVGICLLLRLAAPKVAAIAGTTAKEALSQLLFYLLLVIGVMLLLLFVILPYFTFGEDIKVLKEMGLTVIMLLSIFLAVWTASASIAEEIEGRTAISVLSKPIGRREFILGKFLGVLGPVVLLSILLGAVFLGSVSLKVVYDARESSLPVPTSAECRAEMIQVAPGLALALFETVVFASISVAVATRLPMLGNLMICASIYVLGNLMPSLVDAALQRGYDIPVFVAQFVATVLPVLENFNIYTAISTDNRLDAWEWLSYLGWAGIYCILCSTVALLVGLLLFEDRDLA